MAVSRSGYYKWLGRPKSPRSIRREDLIALVSQIHEEHRSHGYRWTAAYIRINEKKDVSDNFVYRIFRYLGIRSETEHRIRYRPRKTRDRYPNLIFSTWETVDRPRQVLVSDMTAFHIRWMYFELTMYFDVFTKQIVSWRLGERRGDRAQYINGLADVLEVLQEEGCTEPVVLHTDQGSVYASVAYNDLIRDRNISRSMSRAGKPTDNPVNESLNGWIKEELMMDFHLGDCSCREDVGSVISRYVKFYNARRPSWALGYDSPDNYYRRFMAGEIERKDTFSCRELSEIPKFVRKRMSSG
jgi:transposase InsO family protein